MILNIIDKKTGEKVSLDIKDYNFEEVSALWEVVNNIKDFNLNIVNDKED